MYLHRVHVSIQHHGGFLIDILLLIVFPLGNPNKLHEEFLLLRLILFPLKHFDKFPPNWVDAQKITVLWFVSLHHDLPSGDPMKSHEDILSLQTMFPPQRFDTLSLILLLV